MDDAGFRIIPTAEARRALTDGDLRNDVAFQHDVNHLIAVLEELLDSDARYDGCRPRDNVQSPRHNG